jgi:hypothetical protein
MQIVCVYVYQTLLTGCPNALLRFLIRSKAQTNLPWYQAKQEAKRHNLESRKGKKGKEKKRKVPEWVSPSKVNALLEVVGIVCCLMMRVCLPVGKEME